MRVHLISGDPDFMNVRCTNLSDNTALRAVELTNDRFDTSFKLALRYIFREPEDEGVVTDFPYFFTNSALILSSQAATSLAPLLRAAGDVFDTGPPHEMGYKLFVCHDVRAPLDPERVEYVEKTRAMGFHQILQYAFRPEAVDDAGLFRIEGLRSRIYATDRVLEQMAGHHLSGLRIQPLWSSESGPLIRFRDPNNEFQRFPPGYGSTIREKRQAMRGLIAQWSREGEWAKP